MNQKAIKPDQTIVKRLLMLIDPLFFSYNQPKQEKVRQAYYFNHDDLVTEFLFKHVFNLAFEVGTDNEERLTEEQQHLLNAYTTSLCGIGQNSFRFNEMLGKDFDLTRYSTLHDYDLEEFNYQQNAINEHSSETYAEKPYRLHLNHNWVRMIDGEGCFYYSTQSSLAHYVNDKLSEHASKRIDQLIPHSFVEGPDNGKEVESGYLWDFKVDANGLERQLEELKERNRDYLNGIYDQLNDTFDQDPECAVYFDKTECGCVEPHWDVIIKNAQTAKRLSFQSYLKDCETFLKPIEELENLVKQEVEKLDDFLDDNFNDVMDNFDPKVTRLRKKMKVVLSQTALDNLAKIDHDESD